MSIGVVILSYMLSETSFEPKKYHLGCLRTTYQKKLDTLTLFLEHSIEISN